MCKYEGVYPNPDRRAWCSYPKLPVLWAGHTEKPNSVVPIKYRGKPEITYRVTQWSISGEIPPDHSLIKFSGRVNP
jgi:hypothetical protein